MSSVQVGRGEPLLPIVEFDTRTLPVEEQFAAWARFSAYHESEPFAPRAGFRVKAKAWRFGNLMLADTRVDPIRYHRSTARLRADGADHFTVMLQAEGWWRGELDGCRISVGPGQAGVLDMARPMRAWSEAPTRSIPLMVPRDTLDEVLPPFDVHGLVLGEGLGGVFCDHLLALVDRLPELTAAEAEPAARATRDLLAAALAVRQPTGAAAANTKALRARARRHIERNLGTPLSAAGVAAALGVSRSNLYRAFEPLGGVAAYVQKRRLAILHMLLLRPAEHRSISELAFAHGFANATHFGREYKKAYGCTPGETRAATARAHDEHPVAGETPTERFRRLRRAMG